MWNSLNDDKNSETWRLEQTKWLAWSDAAYAVIFTSVWLELSFFGVKNQFFDLCFYAKSKYTSSVVPEPI